MKNDLYKDFIIYDLSEDLANIDCLSSSFVLNWKQYMEDEEYTFCNQFIKCPYCNGEHLVIKNVADRNFSDFIKREKIFYSSKKDRWDYSYLKHTLELQSILDDYAFVLFCDDCKKIITINDKPFFMEYHLSAIDYERLYQAENLMGEYNRPIYCPYCHSRNLFSEEDENATSEHIYCVRCKHYICDKKAEDHYLVNMQYFGKLFS